MFALLAFIGVVAAQPLPEGEVLGATAPPPVAHVSLAPDGSYDLVFQAPQGWQEAEITVSGDRSHDVDAALTDELVRLEGVTSSRGPIRITVQAATTDHRGVTWQFSVDPELVPMPAPELGEPAGRGRKGRKGRRR